MEHAFSCNTENKKPGLALIDSLYLTLQAHTLLTAVLPENVPILCLFFLQFNQHKDAQVKHFRQSLPG